ncbi:MAG: GIY-YIG nuclease family protein [Bdellovibrionota bacterium]
MSLKKRGCLSHAGKAIRLKDRLRSYMNPKLADKTTSVAKMVPQIDDLEWLVTTNEKEALILENNLIKTYRPRYNIMYRDDKSYLSVKVTQHRYPRMYKTRKLCRMGSTYFRDHFHRWRR